MKENEKKWKKKWKKMKEKWWPQTENSFCTNTIFDMSSADCPPNRTLSATLLSVNSVWTFTCKCSACCTFLVFSEFSQTWLDCQHCGALAHTSTPTCADCDLPGIWSKSGCVWFCVECSDFSESSFEPEPRRSKRLASNNDELLQTWRRRGKPRLQPPQISAPDPIPTQSAPPNKCRCMKAPRMSTSKPIPCPFHRGRPL